MGGGSPEYGFNEYLQLGVELGLSGVSFSYWLSVGSPAIALFFPPRERSGVGRADSLFGVRLFFLSVECDSFGDCIRSVYGACRYAG